MDNPVSKPVDLPDKLVDKPVAQPEDKPVDKPVDKLVDKPVAQPVDKPVVSCRAANGCGDAGQGRDARWQGGGQGGQVGHGHCIVE